MLNAKTLRIVMLVVVLSFVSGRTFGDLVTVRFEGAIDQVFDSANLWGGTVNVSQPFSATITYDDTAIDQAGSSTRGTYDYLSFSLTFDQLQLDSGSVTGPGNRDIDIYEGSLGGDDVYVVGFADTGASREFQFGGLTYNQGFLSLGWSDPNILTSDALVEPPPLPADVANIIRVGGTDGSNNAIVVGTISSITVVPEPSAFLFLSVSAIVVGLKRR